MDKNAFVVLLVTLSISSAVAGTPQLRNNNNKTRHPQAAKTELIISTCDAKHHDPSNLSIDIHGKSNVVIIKNSCNTHVNSFTSVSHLVRVNGSNNLVSITQSDFSSNNIPQHGNSNHVTTKQIKPQEKPPQ